MDQNVSEKEDLENAWENMEIAASFGSSVCLDEEEVKAVVANRSHIRTDAAEQARREAAKMVRSKTRVTPIYKEDVELIIAAILQGPTASKPDKEPCFRCSIMKGADCDHCGPPAWDGFSPLNDIIPIASDPIAAAMKAERERIRLACEIIKEAIDVVSMCGIEGITKDGFLRQMDKSRAILSEDKEAHDVD